MTRVAATWMTAVLMASLLTTTAEAGRPGGGMSFGGGNGGGHRSSSMSRGRSSGGLGGFGSSFKTPSSMQSSNQRETGYQRFSGSSQHRIGSSMDSRSRGDWTRKFESSGKGVDLQGSVKSLSGRSFDRHNSGKDSNLGGSVLKGITSKDLRDSRVGKSFGDKLPEDRKLSDSILDTTKISERLGRGGKLDQVLDGRKERGPSELLNKIGSGGLNGIKLNDTLGRNRSQKFDASIISNAIGSGRLDRLVSGKTARKLDLAGQFKLRESGDLVRRLDLGDKLTDRGGWTKRFCGPIGTDYRQHCFDFSYCGPSWYPKRCYYPKWCNWVDWTWSAPCWYDPRPIYCRPIVCIPCPDWTVYDYPVWQPLPVVTCGTWVDVAPIAIDTGVDVQLLAVRLVDNGHPEQELGPRYRVWIRNNSSADLTTPFSVLILAGSDSEPAEGLPQAGVQVNSIHAGETLPVDVRLPFTANAVMAVTSAPKLPMLHVLVDSHRELAEVTEENNGAVLARSDVLPVDPSVFSSETSEAQAGDIINVAGEGLGPEAGQVLVRVGELELQGEIQGWYDLGARVKLPSLPLASDTDAELVIVRGDGAASNPVDIKLATAEANDPSEATATN